jgi:hypothetical protein
MLFQVVAIQPSERGLDPAVGALDVRDPKLVDMAVEGVAGRSHVARCQAQLS